MKATKWYDRSERVWMVGIVDDNDHAVDLRDLGAAEASGSQYPVDWIDAPNRAEADKLVAKYQALIAPKAAPANRWHELEGDMIGVRKNAVAKVNRYNAFSSARAIHIYVQLIKAGGATVDEMLDAIDTNALFIAEATAGASK